MYVEITYNNKGIIGKVVEYYPMFNADNFMEVLAYHWGNRLVSYKLLGTSLVKAS